MWLTDLLRRETRSGRLGLEIQLAIEKAKMRES